MKGEICVESEVFKDGVLIVEVELLGDFVVFLEILFEFFLRIFIYLLEFIELDDFLGIIYLICFIFYFNGNLNSFYVLIEVCICYLFFLFYLVIMCKFKVFMLCNLFL